MPRVSIINPTARLGGLDILVHSLKRQTFQDFECLILDELYTKRSEALTEYLAETWPEGKDRIRHIRPLPKKPGKFWNLDQSINQALCLVDSDLIIFLQDYIWMEEQAVECFMKRNLEMGPCLISGVGHKAQDPNWALNLDGLISIFTDENRPELSEPEKGINQPGPPYEPDPRLGDFRSPNYTLRPAQAIEYETNYASCPLFICHEIGGFDEDFDAGWGYDNVNFAERAQYSGYEIWVDGENQHIGYAHEILFGERELKNQAPNNVALWEKKLESIKEGATKVDCLEQAAGRIQASGRIVEGKDESK